MSEFLIRLKAILAW